ncbi:ATP/GTP-binding protein [Nocardia neocaledoniensis NBRC 108232]|uniref:AAA domain-containing protein n=1 Tax=Nocardia neocaledoniensis TaxID=236511 RepID=A0A317N5N0_9NOCA|nr:ATP-binding protein [Nocardia neocaledoniensis]PWV70460.1 AAA domain-containing protein [Nocardia neocaledoniensis]GEM30810.1 ATP/GTP-binding protein [Nocardia neocaledoniensis NBRC 108232]
MTIGRDLQPTAAVRGNLQFTRSGLVTATYFISPLGYGLRKAADKHDVKLAHHTMINSLPDGSLLLGIQARLNTKDVLTKMVEGVDLDVCEDYADEVVASYERIRAIVPHTRLFLLSIPVGAANSGVSALSRLWRNSTATIDATSLSRADLEIYDKKAAEVLSKIGSEFDPVPVPAALFQWLWEHYLSRGGASDPDAPTESGMLEDATAAVFRAAALDEGAQTDGKRRVRPSFVPVVKVVQPEFDQAPSYQAMLTPHSFPYSGMGFPGGSEFLNVLEGLGDVTVDWGMRISTRSADQVLRNNELNLRRLGEQMDQRDQEVSFAQNTLAAKAQMLGEYNHHFEVNSGESEVTFTTVIAVGSSSREVTMDAVNALKRRYKRFQVEMIAPLGAQVDLWSMLVPGAPHRRAFDDFAHIVPSDMWAGFVPFISSQVGDDSGPVIGVNLLSGHFEPIHFGIMEAALHDLSASFAVTGELGSGKSYFLKLMAVLVHDMGGQFLAIDRSQVGEWEHFAASIDDAVVVDLANPTVSLDPLRLFDRRVAGERALDTLLPLLDLSPTSGAGAIVSNLLSPNSLAANDICTMLDLYRVLCRRRDSSSGDPDHADVAARMAALVERVPVLFDSALKPLRLDAAATVVRSHNLALPTAEELTTPHLYSRLPLTKRLGTALYELVGVTAREAFLSDNGRFGLLVGDEAHHFTQTQVGAAVTSDFSRDGRKHLAAIGLASHDPATDFRGAAHNLIPNRFVFRQRDEVLARNSLEWLGVDLDEAPYLLQVLREETSPPVGIGRQVPQERRGEMFMRDALSRIGRGKVLGPARPDRAAAITSTPQSERGGKQAVAARASAHPVDTGDRA